MKIVKASYEILTPISEGGIEELQRIERAARTCYKSEDKITPDGSSAEKLVKSLIKRGHEAMLEHSQLSVKFICDRGVSHELVRHRLASYAQESSRGCNYSQDKFGDEITVIEPCFYDMIPKETKEFLIQFLDGKITPFSEISEDMKRYARWYDACRTAENEYFRMLEFGATTEEARNILPNSLKTEIVMTANYREWRKVFQLRCATDAHPQMREIMVPLCLELQEKLPIIFDDCYPLGQEIVERRTDGKPISGRYPMTEFERRVAKAEEEDLRHKKQVCLAHVLANDLGYTAEAVSKKMHVPESTVRYWLKEKPDFSIWEDDVQ